MFVKKVDGIDINFIFGADVSTYLSLKKSGVVFYGTDGKPECLMKILKYAGFNYVRLRVWNDPFDQHGRGYGAGNCDAACVSEIGKLATNAGLRVKLAFHYSDFWADPGKQMSPKAWRGMDIKTRSQELHDFTYSTIKQMAAAGVDIGIIAIGNENNATSPGGGMAGVDGSWDNLENAVDLLSLFHAGCNAARKIILEHDLNAKIAVHIADPNQAVNLKNFAARLAESGVDYDIYGSSYYPFWHGTLQNLTEVLTHVSTLHDKDVLCVETSYPATREDGDGFHVYNLKHSDEYPYAITPQGQAHSFRDTAQAIADVGRGLGVFLWEPAWVPIPEKNWAKRFHIWEEFGSGWASSFSGEYNPQNETTYGGSGWDNKGLFDFSGFPLPSLSCFKDMAAGRREQIEVDTANPAEASITQTGRVTEVNVLNALPKDVLVFYNDNTKVNEQIKWQVSGMSEIAMPGVHYIDVYGSHKSICMLRVAPPNLVRNPGFEDESMQMWDVCCRESETVYAGRRELCPRFGDYAFGFYRPLPLHTHVTIKQKVKIPENGTYNCQLSVTGDYDKSSFAEFCLNVYIGEQVFKQDFDLPGYGKWEVPHINGIELEAGDEVVIEVVFIADNGAVCSLDDVYFYRA